MFDPFDPDGDGSFAVELTGESVLCENQEEVSRSPASASWRIWPNVAEERWEVRTYGHLLAELAYVSQTPDSEDRSIETTVYEFPSLNVYPDYPQNEIRVRRETVYGASLPTPIWVQIDETKISFSAPGGTVKK